MKSKRRETSSESETPKTRRSLPTRLSRPVRAAMKDGSEEDELINEVTITQLDKVLRESIRTAKKDAGLKSDDDLPPQFLGPGPSKKIEQNNHPSPQAEAVSKRKRGRPRKNPNLKEPVDSKSIYEVYYDLDNLSESDPESDESEEYQTRAQLKKTNSQKSSTTSPPKKSANLQQKKARISNTPESTVSLRQTRQSRQSIPQSSSLNVSKLAVVKTSQKILHKTSTGLATKAEKKTEGNKMKRLSFEEKEDFPLKRTRAVSSVSGVPLKKISFENATISSNNEPKKQQSGRKAETDIETSSDFDSDRESLPNIKISPMSKTVFTRTRSASVMSTSNKGTTKKENKQEATDIRKIAKSMSKTNNNSIQMLSRKGRREVTPMEPDNNSDESGPKTRSRKVVRRDRQSDSEIFISSKRKGTFTLQKGKKEESESEEESEEYSEQEEVAKLTRSQVRMKDTLSQKTMFKKPVDAAKSVTSKEKKMKKYISWSRPQYNENKNIRTKCTMDSSSEESEDDVDEKEKERCPSSKTRGASQKVELTKKTGEFSKRAKARSVAPSMSLKKISIEDLKPSTSSQFKKKTTPLSSSEDESDSDPRAGLRGPQRQPQSATALYTDGWTSSEDERFDLNILEKAKVMVKEVYGPILEEHQKVMEEEFKKIQNHTKYLPPKRYMVHNQTNIKPFELEKERIEVGDELSMVYTKMGELASEPVKIHYITTREAWPRMKHWTHIEQNIKTDDCQRLSHIPYIDDEHDSKAFVRDLKKAYPEGIRGTSQGWNKHISDYLLYRLLKEIVPKWEKTRHGMDHLYQAIYRLFPNKLSARQLEHIFPSLDERFAPKLKRLYGERGKEDTSHTIKTLFCIKCLQYHCALHGVSGEQFKMHRKPNTAEAVIPCSPKCYLNLPDDKINSDVKKRIPSIKVRPYSAANQRLFNKYAQVNRFNTCQVRKMMADFEERTCQEVYYLLQQNLPKDREMSPEDIMKRKLTMKEVQSSFRNFTWNLGGGHVDNSDQPNTCKHTGVCSKNNDDCLCARKGNLCFKFCSCGVDCKMRFPGCRCQPGQCKTKQCQCFYLKWECDPDTCKTCNCGPLGEDMKPGKGKDGLLESDESESEMKTLIIQGELPPVYSVEEIPICSNINISRGNYKKLLVGLSNVAGYGCFINEECEKGEFIAEYTGEVISKWEAERRGRIYDEYKTSYIFALNQEQAVDATRLGNYIRFANHSDKHANCYSQIMMVNGEHRIGIFAKRKLYANEELLFDYQYNKQWKVQFCPNELNPPGPSSSKQCP